MFITKWKQYKHRENWFFSFQYQYLACCVKSGEDILTHRKSIIELLNEKNLRILGNIRHCCGCHLAPDLPNNTIEKMENASIPASFDLAGVPTFCILDIKGEKIYSLKFFCAFLEALWSMKRMPLCMELRATLSKASQEPNISCGANRERTKLCWERKTEKFPWSIEENQCVQLYLHYHANYNWTVCSMVKPIFPSNSRRVLSFLSCCLFTYLLNDLA